MRARFDFSHKSVNIVSTGETRFEEHHKRVNLDHSECPMKSHYEKYQDYKAAHAVESSYEDLLELEFELK